jgi:hypothetical protein
MPRIFAFLIPKLSYSQSHANQLSRMHLRYVIKGEITEWTEQLIQYITDPRNNIDSGNEAKSE